MLRFLASNILLVSANILYLQPLYITGTFSYDAISSSLFSIEVFTLSINEPSFKSMSLIFSIFTRWWINHQWRYSSHIFYCIMCIMMYSHLGGLARKRWYTWNFIMHKQCIHADSDNAIHYLHWCVRFRDIMQFLYQETTRETLTTRVLEINWDH